MELRVEDLRKRYGGTAVLQGVSFTAEIGLTRVMGSSGIGKTTLLRILLGLAQDVEEETFPWTDEGVEALKAWYQSQYEKFLAAHEA